MIYVDREKNNLAQGFKNKEWSQAASETGQALRDEDVEKHQVRIDFLDPGEFPDLKKRVMKDFNFKCAYTEAPLDSKDAVIIRHWPASDAMNLNGTTSHYHYWWLAYEWRNLLPVLPECARAKGSYFPMKGRPRKWVSGFEDEKIRRKELLPYPCNPDPFGKFTFDGVEVIPSYATDDYSGVSSCIEILGLNTERVMSLRNELSKSFQPILEALLEEFNDEGLNRLDPKFLRNWIAEDSPFVEYRIYLTVNYFQNVRLKDNEILASWVPLLRDHLHSIFPHQPFIERFDPEFIAYLNDVLGSAGLPLLKELKESLEGGVEVPEEEEPSEEIVPEAEQGLPHVTGMCIERVSIRNFKGIKKMEVDFNKPVHKDDTPCLMVMGENASGKSSILQAIALCLEEPEQLNDLAPYPYLRPEKILNRGSDEGYVKIKFLDNAEELEIHFRKGSDGYIHKGPYEKYKFYLRGYGAHRLLPRFDHEENLPEEKPLVDINNLWDPYEFLLDAGRWIEDLAANDKSVKTSVDAGNREEAGLTDFDLLVRALKDLLNLDMEGFIKYDEKGLSFSMHNQRMELDDLSAGFQSIIGMAADVIYHSPFVGADPQKIRGIVLIDEVGAHLHPTWRMRIMNAYRRTFPYVQFIVTTHEPLCLRGMREGELVVMRKGTDYVSRLEEVPNVENMRIDQILTSPIFGMNTTVDPDVEEKFNRYYDLLAKSRLSKKEKEECDSLKHDLYRFGVLGMDRRARAIYDLIDKDLASQRSTGGSGKLTRKTKDLVLEIWNNSEL